MPDMPPFRAHRLLLSLPGRAVEVAAETLSKGKLHKVAADVASIAQHIAENIGAVANGLFTMSNEGTAFGNIANDFAARAESLSSRLSLSGNALLYQPNIEEVRAAEVRMRPVNLLPECRHILLSLPEKKVLVQLIALVAEKTGANLSHPKNLSIFASALSNVFITNHLSRSDIIETVISTPALQKNFGPASPSIDHPAVDHEVDPTLLN